MQQQQKNDVQRNVVALRRRDADAISHLEQLLDHAKSGLISGVAAAVSYADGEIGVACSGLLCRQPATGLAAIHALREAFIRRQAPTKSSSDGGSCVDYVQLIR